VIFLQEQIYLGDNLFWRWYLLLIEYKHINFNSANDFSSYLDKENNSGNSEIVENVFYSF
jgi:hypothetical protein